MITRHFTMAKPHIANAYRQAKREDVYKVANDVIASGLC